MQKPRRAKSAQELIDSIETPHVRNWYQKYLSDSKLYIDKSVLLLDYLSKRAVIDGYEFDAKSGLFIKEVFPEKIAKRVGRTIVNIIFPRPVDQHYHEDVGEAFYVISGNGAFRKVGEGMFFSEPIQRGSTTFADVGEYHAFSPDPGDYLEMAIVCTGVMDFSKEKCVTRFDKYQPWLDFFKDAKRSKK